MWLVAVGTTSSSAGGGWKRQAGMHGRGGGSGCIAPKCWLLSHRRLTRPCHLWWRTFTARVCCAAHPQERQRSKEGGGSRHSLQRHPRAALPPAGGWAAGPLALRVLGACTPPHHCAIDTQCTHQGGAQGGRPASVGQAVHQTASLAPGRPRHRPPKNATPPGLPPHACGAQACHCAGVHPSPGPTTTHRRHNRTMPQQPARAVPARK